MAARNLLPQAWRPLREREVRDVWLSWGLNYSHNGLKAGSRRHFAERLREQGLKPYSNGSERRYCRARLLAGAA